MSIGTIILIILVLILLGGLGGIGGGPFYGTGYYGGGGLGLVIVIILILVLMGRFNVASGSLGPTGLERASLRAPSGQFSTHRFQLTGGG